MKYKVPRTILATITFMMAFIIAIQFNQGVLLYPILALSSILIYFGKVNIRLLKKHIILLFLFYPFGLFSFSLISMAHNFHLIKANTFTFAWPIMLLLNLIQMIPGLVVYHYTYTNKTLDASLQASIINLFKGLLKTGWFLLAISLALAFLLETFWLFFILLSFSFSIAPMIAVPKEASSAS